MCVQVPDVRMRNRVVLYKLLLTAIRVVNFIVYANRPKKHTVDKAFSLNKNNEIYYTIDMAIFTQNVSFV